MAAAASTAKDVNGEKQAAREGVLIVNTKAREGREWYDNARTHLTNFGVTLTAAHALEDPSKMPDLVRDSVKSGAKLIIIGGGDGSFSSTVDFLANTDVALGVLPLGTVNDFARNLQIPVDVEAACRIIADGHTTQVDLGMANENYFTITTSLGFSALTQNALSPQLKKKLGPFGYVTAGIIALRKMKPRVITVKSEKGTEQIAIVQAGVVSAHAWMGGKIEIPNVDLQSGGFAFYAVPPQSGLRAYLHLAQRLLRGHIFHTHGLIAFRTCDITIETPVPQPLVVDGDLCGETPVRLRIAPKALRVCVPAHYSPENL